jgi:GNAT superfamily N-acetyltransferase
MNQAASSVIRIASSAERRACFMLLPELAEGYWEDPRVLVSESPYQLLGVCCWRFRSGGLGSHSLQILLRVLPPFTGQGLGQHMLEYLWQVADQQKIRKLDLLLDSCASPALLSWLKKRGFCLHESEEIVAAPIAPFYELCSTLLSRVRTRGGLLSAASVTSLQAFPLNRVRWLYAKALSVPSWLAQRRLEEASVAHHACPRLVLLVNGDPVGLLLSQPHGSSKDTGIVTLEAVAPHMQASSSGIGSAHLMLISEAMRLAVDRGYEQMQFSWLEGNRPTSSLARRVGATQVRRLLVWRCTHRSLHS